MFIVGVVIEIVLTLLWVPGWARWGFLAFWLALWALWTWLKIWAVKHEKEMNEQQ